MSSVKPVFHAVVDRETIPSGSILLILILNYKEAHE